MADELPEQRDWRPIPDPTLLTTEQLNREIASLRELLEARIDSHALLDDNRFAALEHRIARQLSAIEQQRVEQKEDTRTAVDAALTAQKEAIIKSDAATTKSIDQLAKTFEAVSGGQQEILVALKERITAVEQQKVGAHESRTASSTTIGLVIAAFGIIISLVVVMANVLTTQ